LIHEVHKICGIDEFRLTIVSNITDQHDIVSNIIETKQMIVEFNSAMTPLCMALGNNNSYAAKKWLEIDCNVDYTSGDSDMYSCPLILALVFCPSMFMTILSYAADVNITDHTGSTALHYAAKFDEYNNAKCLFDKNARVDVYNHSNMAPVNYATNNNMAQLVRCN
jgi:ankyrin repeat protein